MTGDTEPRASKARGQNAKTHSSPGGPNSGTGVCLADAIGETTRLWRKHHLDYDQTKYIVE